VKRAFLVVAAVGLLAAPASADSPVQSNEIDPDDVLLSVSVEETGDQGARARGTSRSDAAGPAATCGVTPRINVFLPTRKGLIPLCK